MITQDQFDKMMEDYLARRDKLPASSWAKEYIDKAKALGITDGSAPRGFTTREEAIAIEMRGREK